MPPQCQIGDTFFLPDISGGHRWVVLTKPNDDDEVVIANFTDARNIDCPVVFTPKDDRNLFNKRTTINYDKAQLFPADKLIEPLVTCWKPCQQNHVKKIIINAFLSRDIHFDVFNELKSQYPSEFIQSGAVDFFIIYRQFPK